MSFSVLMSVYDRENPAWFRESLKSVMEQTLVPDEVVIMQDGPLTEELLSVLSEAMDAWPQIRTVAIPEHVYLGRALAMGVEECRYDRIARMDTDDIARPDRFEKQMAYLDAHPETAALGGSMEEFFSGSAEAESLPRQVKTMPLDEDAIRRYARYRNPLNHMTVMFVKQAVLSVGNYRHFPFLEDYDLWCRLLAQGAVLANLPDVLVEARTNPDLYKRRGGLSYFKQYKKHRKNQKEEGILSFPEYLIALLLTLGMTLQPSGLRKLTYRKLLRKKQ